MSAGKWLLVLLLSVAVTAATLAAFWRVTSLEVGQANAAVIPAPTDLPTAGAPVVSVDVAASAPQTDAEAPAAADGDAVDAAAETLAAAAPAPATAPATVAPNDAAPAAPAAPSAVKVVISTVHKPGQRALEYVLLANEGAVVDMTGWTIETPRGVVYTFPDFVFFQQTFVRVYTMNGANTPTSLFWNQNEALWKPGDEVLLKNGAVEMARFTVK